MNYVYVVVMEEEITGYHHTTLTDMVDVKSHILLRYQSFNNIKLKKIYKIELYTNAIHELVLEFVNGKMEITRKDRQ